MIAKAASALGRSIVLGEIDIYARFAVLFAVAVASVIAFYMSVILTIGILAEEAGAVGAHAQWPSYVGLVIVGRCQRRRAQTGQHQQTRTYQGRRAGRQHEIADGHLGSKCAERLSLCGSGSKLAPGGNSSPWGESDMLMGAGPSSLPR